MTTTAANSPAATKPSLLSTFEGDVSGVVSKIESGFASIGNSLASKVSQGVASGSTIESVAASVIIDLLAEYGISGPTTTALVTSIAAALVSEIETALTAKATNPTGQSTATKATT